MKERTGRMIKKQDKGFTLIEMIVTVSIIAVFAGVLLTLVTTGSNLFRGVSGNTKAQVDAQETLDAIEDLLIDANRSVYYAYGDGSNVGAEITNDIESSNSAFKTLLVCNEYENGDGSSRYVVDVLDWDGQEGKLYYSQREYTKASSSETEQETDTDEETVQLQSQEEFQAVPANIDFSDKVRDAKEVVQRSVFAQGIENFTADMTKVEEERIARFRLTTKNNGKEVKTLHTVNLRNQIQVQKPDDAFAEAGSTDVKIKIVGAPESIQAGTSAILRYELECSGSGSIDPTTVHWEIVNNKENGYFPEADPTYGKLTVADSADGTITVIVSAVTTDGKTVTSAPVTVKILTIKKVTGIRADKTEFLAAAGYDGLNLGSVVTWKYIYNDGSEDTTPVDVTWKIKQQYGFANVTSAGQVHIEAEAGMADTGSFEILATDDTYGFSGAVTVKIARIDLLQPEDNRVYSVGDEKNLSYTYMEAGAAVDHVTASFHTQEKPETALNDYVGEGEFIESDIGKWKVRASVNLSVRGGYGVVKSAVSFRVENGLTGDGNIQINQNDEISTIVAGNTYECAPTVNWGFNFWPNGKGDAWEYYELKWSLDQEYTGIHLQKINDSQAQITVDAANDNTVPSGFTLQAEYIQYTDATRKTVKDIKTGFKNVNVAYGIELTSSQKNAYVGEEYFMRIGLKVSRWNGTKTIIPVSSTGDGVKTSWEKSHSSVSGSVRAMADGTWCFVPQYYVVDESITVSAHLQEMKGIFCPKTTFFLYDAITVNVCEPPMTAKIIPEGDETIEYGNAKELSVEIIDRYGKDVLKNVNWSVSMENSYDVAGTLSKYYTKTKEKVLFSATKTGTYIVTVQYESIQNKFKQIQKKIIVQKPKVDTQSKFTG